MSGSLDQIIEVDISLSASAVSQPSFSIPLIVGPTAADWVAEWAHVYTSPAEMLLDGFITSSPEYIYALEMFSQALTPTQFVVGHRTVAVAQVDTITPTPVNTTHYIVTIDGTAFDYTSDSDATAAEIVTGLKTLINADSACKAAGTGSTTLILTAKIAGVGFTTTVNTNQALVHTTASNGIQDDLAAIIAANNTWYGMCLASGSDADVLQAAAFIEAIKKIYIAISDTSAVADTAPGGTDVGSVLQIRAYKRTGLMYTVADNVTEGREAAWLGGLLPTTPGASSWAFKSLSGITADDLTANEQNNLIGDPVAGTRGKNVNIYQLVSGANITQMGTMAGGQFIDVTVGIDWLQATIQTNIYQLLVDTPKIPYTDKGTAMLEQQVQAAIDQGVANGLIDGNSPITITAPLVATVSPTQRANRIAPTISFSCRLAGAYNAIIVQGTVTV